MCLGIPAKIIEINGDSAVVDVLGARRKASLGLITEAKPGDYILLHAGCAIQKVDIEEAEKTLELFAEIAGMKNGGRCGDDE